MNMDDKVWWEVWFQDHPYFWSDDDSPYKYETLQDAEDAIQSIWNYSSEAFRKVAEKHLEIKVCFTLRISI